MEHDRHQSRRAGRRWGSFAALAGIAVFASACEKSPAERAAEQRSDQIQQQGEQAAERMREQAGRVEDRAGQRADQTQDQIQQQGRAQADQLRTQADRTEHGAEQSADAIRNQAREQDRQQPYARGGGPVPVDQAQEQLAAARCDHEQQCGRIGNGRRYTDRNACLASLRSEHLGSWHGATCSSGLNAGRLSDCLSAVRGQACGREAQGVSGVSACGGNEVCRQ